MLNREWNEAVSTILSEVLAIVETLEANKDADGTAGGQLPDVENINGSMLLLNALLPATCFAVENRGKLYVVMTPERIEHNG